MTFLTAAAIFVAAYLLILARNAWRAGEFRQYALSLAIVVGLIGAIALVVMAWIALFGG